MALIKCPECGNDVSDKAECCPHCGINISNIKDLEELSKKKENEIKEKQQRQTTNRTIIIVVVVVIALIIGMNLFADYSKKKEKKEIQNRIDYYNNEIEKGEKEREKIDKLIEDYEKYHK